MRVAYVITRSDAVGGAHVHVRDLAHQLLRVGHQVHVLVGGEGPFTDELRTLGIPFRSLQHLVRPIRPLDDTRGVMELRRLLSEVKPDLVSTHSSKAGWLGRLAARSLHIPVIFTAHGWAFTDGVPQFERRFYALAERLAAPLARRIIAVSEYDRRLAIQYRVAPPHQVVTIHNGMPDVPPELLARPGLHPPHLIMVARFEPQKDHVTLIKALAGLKDIPWTIEFVGNGPVRKQVEKLCASLGLADRVKFLGARHDVANRLAGAQLFVLVSRWEGLPRSILEAMRAALPVVASDVGGVREAVADGQSGFLVPRGDVEALRNRLSILIERPELRVRMGLAGRRRYEEHFTFERMFRKTMEVYADVIKNEARMRPVKFIRIG